MKYLKIFFLLILFHNKTLAMCAFNGISYWPRTEKIKQNPIIVLEGYGSSQETINKLNSVFPVYIQAGDIKIKLIIKEITKGEFQLTKVILKPEKALEAGLNYKLVIDNLSESERDHLQKWNKQKDTYEDVSWLVQEGSDNISPIWIKKPVEKKKTLVYYGCGPAKNVHFTYKIKDSSDIMIKVILTDLTNKTTTTYYVEPEKLNSFKVGHDMCSGGFYLKGNDFEAAFDLIDASGNITVWKDSKIRFSKPTKPTNDE